jgi:putative SOS response-associated peptidase YedK
MIERMCGRINMGLDPTDLVDELDIEHVAYVHRELYNVPPGGTLPIIVDRPDADGTLTRRLEPARWGLVPRLQRTIGDGADEAHVPLGLRTAASGDTGARLLRVDGGGRRKGTLDDAVG